MQLDERGTLTTLQSKPVAGRNGFANWLSGHVARTADLAYRLALVVGADSPEQIRYGALLHDLGKTVLPPELVGKRGSLSPGELRLVRTHPEIGFRLAARLSDVGQVALEAILYHHERLDGSGYPCGLQGSAIPLTARIVAVADVWDALISPRPYKPAWSPEEAAHELKALAGTKLDPNLVNAFLPLVVPAAHERP